MIKEAYCFFEVARLLKEKGFNEVVHAYHNIYDKVNLDFFVKANKAPEKIFICDYGSELGFEWHSESDWEQQGSNDIEYTRTDVLIEKAAKYLANNMRCNEYTPQTKAKFIRKFKKYMGN